MTKRIDEQALHQKHYAEIREKVADDPFARSLGIHLTKFEETMAEAEILVQAHMVNAYGTVHGAVIYALADHVLSVASNAHGKASVGLSTNAQFIQAAQPGDLLTARAVETKRNFRVGFYRVDVLRGEEIIATVDAVSYRKNQYFVETE
ncbi:PaaI family thioesterase [Planococcus sp. ISL-109]|uniref:PaaI family thioesterase n=1 Tax=Planococcus sp. ISL-109 TaxID=2819166 RepID=UPI001BEC62F9|nr:PaaI family thioesterase [Planococcus sp. ISL-109]MBT2582944.1 PaaI family thioesterase [Planococcus sp. ISL-109]